MFYTFKHPRHFEEVTMLLPTGELSNCSPLWGGDWQHPGIVWLPRTSLAKGIQTDQCAYKSLFIAFICFRESMFFAERHIWKKFCHPYLTFHFALFRQYIVSQPSRYCRDKHWMKQFPSHLLNLWDSFPCKENILKLTHLLKIFPTLSIWIKMLQWAISKREYLGGRNLCWNQC